MTLPETRDNPENLEMLPGTEPSPASPQIEMVDLALIVLWSGSGWRSGTATQTAPTKPETTAGAEPSFAEVVVTDLVETSEYEGTLGRLDGDPINVRLDGTVTALPEEGTTLEQGDVIAWVDNQPVVLLYGELPVWREMRNDSEGPDVLQLETALTALGYNESGR